MGRKTLVICAEIAHIKLLEPMLQSQGLNVAVATGSASSRERKKMLDALDAGHYDYIICSTIFDEGVDLPNIGGVVIAAGNKSAPALLQRTGRAIRKKEEENYAVIVDFYDTTHSVLLFKEGFFQGFRQTRLTMPTWLKLSTWPRSHAACGCLHAGRIPGMHPSNFDDILAVVPQHILEAAREQVVVAREQ